MFMNLNRFKFCYFEFIIKRSRKSYPIIKTRVVQCTLLQQVNISYLEIHLDEVRDLLSSTPEEVHIREDEKGNTLVRGKLNILEGEKKETLVRS